MRVISMKTAAIAAVAITDVSAVTCPGGSWTNAPVTLSNGSAPVAKLDATTSGSVVKLGETNLLTAAPTGSDVTCATNIVDPVCWNATFKTTSDDTVWVGGCAPSTLADDEDAQAMTTGCAILSKLILGAAGDGSNGTLTVMQSGADAADSNYSIVAADFNCTPTAPKMCPTATIATPVTKTVFDQTSSQKACAEGSGADCWMTTLKAADGSADMYAGGCVDAGADATELATNCTNKKTSTTTSGYNASQTAKITGNTYNLYDATADPSVFSCPVPEPSNDSGSPASQITAFLAIAAGFGYMLL